MAKVCNKEDCPNPVFGGGYCKYHQNLRNGIKPRTIKRISSKGLIKRAGKRELIEEDKLFYLLVWGCREHFCYECGKGLSEPLILYFHHILEKRNYPELRHTIENIVLLCWQCHSQVETNIDKCPKTKQLTEKTRLCLLNK